ncbi:MAG TPA: bifunctional adenosylcobinamide kinase/adenosylcobinamide-phosphate guanylyltransferase [Thermodesulfovibrionales bacterium]|nr:bifunctional adenosylcobinamide kinase/adenosylcobinamide-phosphate guanylyltransferase [Thermodesulfovibrionales bacterium]
MTVNSKGTIIFVLGGARSGKSGFALRDASARQGKKAYIATAQALDQEMEERIAKHREERASEWKTFEEPLRLSALIEEACISHEVVLVDCLTLWLSNLLLGEERPDDPERTEKELEKLLKLLQRFQASDSHALYLVSNEVGMGIVPDNALSRRFRDLAGRVNQKVAEIADAVYFVAAGIPLKLK